MTRFVRAWLTVLAFVLIVLGFGTLIGVLGLVVERGTGVWWLGFPAQMLAVTALVAWWMTLPRDHRVSRAVVDCLTRVGEDRV